MQVKLHHYHWKIGASANDGVCVADGKCIGAPFTRSQDQAKLLKNEKWKTETLKNHPKTVQQLKNTMYFSIIYHVINCTKIVRNNNKSRIVKVAFNRSHFMMSSKHTISLKCEPSKCEKIYGKTSADWRKNERTRSLGPSTFNSNACRKKEGERDREKSSSSRRRKKKHLSETPVK